MNKQHILDEIRRTAAENGGKPLGRLRLEREAGIKEYQWGKYWARYNDVLREAGFAPNAMAAAHSEHDLLRHVVGLARELGRFPTQGDLLVKRTSDDSFPSPGAFDRLGTKAELVAKVSDFCAAHAENDVLALCPVYPASPSSTDARSDTPPDGFVYLLKSGRFYKIGKTNSVGRRERDLALQLPERAKTVHSIRTDDPDGIEDYWHRRFSGRRKNGEWFDLTTSDIAAFRRRKFM